MGNKSKFERFIDVAKALFEIAAIVVGGYWTYTKFIRVEEPALEHNFQIAATLRWDKLEAKSPCLAVLAIDVTNESKSASAVSKVVRRAWFVPRPKDLQGIKFFDPHENPDRLGPPDENKEYFEGALVQMYPPGASVHQTFTWFVENRPDTYTLFEIAFYEKTNDSEPSDSKYAWDTTCNVVESTVQRRDERSAKPSEPTQVGAPST